MSAEGFWSDSARAQAISKQLAVIRDKVEFWEKIEKDIVDLEAIAKLAVEEADANLEKDLEKKYLDIKKRYEEARISTFLSAKYDDHGAIVSIHGGGGGPESHELVRVPIPHLFLFFQ